MAILMGHLINICIKFISTATASFLTMGSCLIAKNVIPTNIPRSTTQATFFLFMVKSLTCPWKHKQTCNKT